MPKLSRNTSNLFKVTSILSLMLLVVSSLIPGHSLAAKTAVSNKNAKPGETQLITGVAAASNGTFQDFDLPNTGTPYSVGVHVPQPTPAPVVTDGGPTGSGKMLRLAFGTPPISHNSIAFERSDPGAFDQIVADFDFRITPGTGRADGLGFALLNTTRYGITGAVAPVNVAEEPNFTGSLSIGFDVYRSDGNPPEINDNHISVHFNGAQVQEFDARPALDLAGSEWVHARIIMRPGGSYSDVTVILTQCGRPPVTLIDRLRIPEFTPYEGRAYFAARSGGLTADHEIDNVHVQFLRLGQNVLAFRTGCYSVVETGDQQRVVVERMGSSTGTTTVHYTTTVSSTTTATPGLDYTATSGTLTFNTGEITKTLSVPILDDTTDEGDESFLITLNGPSGDAVVGGPAIAKVTIVDDESSRREGHWSEVIPSQVVPIHMHLLPTGKVMYWDRHDHEKVWDGDPRLWEPATEMIAATKVPTLTYDLFCSGHSFMENGDLLVSGGHITGTTGEDEASIYHPFTNTWTRLPRMNAGRWYPSNVTLANGDVLAMGGTHETGLNILPQVWETITNTWRDLTTAQLGKNQTGYYPTYPDYYPFLYVAPNGKVFNAGPQQVARYLDPSGTGTWTDVATSTLLYRDYGSSVLYDEGKVLIVGGNPRDDTGTVPPSASAEIINLNDANPTWRSVAPMHFGRRHLNATLLPDGKVLVTGGSRLPGFDNQAGAVLQAEMWNPTTEQWTVMAAQARYRGYHSNALLLPDGRVLVGGGGHPEPAVGAQYNFEIYSPPYLFKGSRPVIRSAPAKVGYGQSFFIETPDAANITRATLIRLSSATHAFNQNQRSNQLQFTKTADGLNITTPMTPNLAPPGHYMLFILNSDGVPSEARIIRLGLTVAIDDSYSTAEGTVLTVNKPGVLINDTDVDGHSLTASLTISPTHGTLALQSDGSFTYTPNADYHGSDSFTYTVNNGAGRTDTAVVNIIDYRVYLPLTKK